MWSAGCATGEEAYSLAILVAEVLGNELEQWTVRIFATDLDGDAINFARRGVYPASALEELPPELRARYFTETAGTGTYSVSKPVRSMLVFGEHDLGQRPPFPRIDLCLCRNVLIYFTPDLQERALETFAFALRDGGLLVLGKAETANALPAYFTPMHAMLRIYRRLGTPLLMPHATERATLALHRHDGLKVRREVAQDLARVRQESAQAHAAQLAAETLLLGLPVGVIVVDRRYDIQRINSKARRLLGIHTEALGSDLIHLVQDVPSQQLRTAIDAAIRGEPTTLESVPTGAIVPGEARFVQISCQMISLDATSSGPTVVLVITDATRDTESHQEEEKKYAWLTAASLLTRQTRDEEVAQAEAEKTRFQELLDQVSARNRELLAANEALTTANVLLRSTTEEYLIGNEEIQAATEEVETLNEELQSTNEELETLNEEQQATVEELETTNDELRSRSQEAGELAVAVQAQWRQLTAILESMEEGVLVLDSEGHIVFTNAAFVTMMEPAGGGAFVAEDANGQPLPPEETPQQRVQRGESFRMEFTLMGMEGQRHWYEATGRPLSDRTMQRDALLVIRDITDRTLRRLQDAFLALASHELRTPLTSIQGYLSLIVKDQQKQGDQTRLARHSQIALDEAYRLHRLINDLLDVGRLQSGKLTLMRAPIDLSGVVARAVETTQATMGERPVRLDSVGGPLLVDGDGLRLEQVVLNLLTNARTYAPSSPIDVRVRRQDGVAEVEVQDYGPGIAPEALPDLFNRFYQVATAPRGAQGGMGLGLYIAREITEAHGGTITVSSTVGKGATFQVRLPLIDDTAGPASPGDGQPAPTL